MSDFIKSTSLPFRYDLTVFPSAKSRTLQSATAREYTLIEVSDVSPAEMRPVIRHEGYDVPHFEQRQTGIVYAYNKLLYRPATDQFTGAPLVLAEFEFAVSADVAHYLVHGVTKPASRLDPDQYPTPCDGSGLHEGNPLAHRALDQIVIDDWKPTWRPKASERDREERSAQVFLSEAIVTVDGVVFVACPEPVWAVDAYDAEELRVRLEPNPAISLAATYFRLDRLEEARDWARRRGGSDAAPPPVEILDETVLRRDDEWALAACLVSCGHLRGALDDDDEGNVPDDDPAELVGRLVHSIRKQQRGPREEEVIPLLDGLRTSMDAAGDWPLTLHDLTNERLSHIRERWELAEGAGRGAADRQPFDQDDLAAIEDLARELNWAWSENPFP